MAPRRIGLAYLGCVVADAAISIAASLDSSLEAFSDSFSLGMFVFTVVVMLLVFMGKLRPVLPFLAPVVLYICFFWFGVGLGIVVSVDEGTGGQAPDVNHDMLREMFPWYGATSLALAVLLLVTGVGSLWSALRFSRSDAVEAG